MKPLNLVPIKSLSERVADSIVEGIASGAIRPEQRIIEGELAEQLNVSRIPVREALKILSAQGIVVGRPYHGMRVATFDDEKIRQIYEVRCCFEKIAIRDARLHRAGFPGLLKRLDAVVAKMADCLKKGDLLGISKADLEFHHEICLASQNDIVITLWDGLSRHMLIVFEQELLGDAERAYIVEHHRSLRRALERGTPQELSREIESHIMRLRGKPAVTRQEMAARTRGLAAISKR
ncbi:MAG TPA: GntR family transcriptional regulator [Aestuariivirgaceae bacterium]|nr:GntR family transcriptional regulator [Aestuariivirgaceae bacterium]